MKPFLVTMNFTMMDCEEPGRFDHIDIQEYLERQWCSAAGIFFDVQLDVVELAPVADKATEKASTSPTAPVTVNDQGLTTEDYYDHFVRAQERVAKSVNALLDVAPKWSEEIQKAIFAELEPLLSLADLVDMKTR